MTVSIYSYWGKAQPEKEGQAQYHLLPYHCLDVAAVGQVFLKQHHSLRKLLASGLGLDEDTFLAWQVFFLALHDIGKFSKRFQGMIQKWPDAECYNERHDNLGWLLWCEKLAAEVIAQANLGDLRQRIKHRVLGHWAQTVIGHHGQPPENFWDSNKPVPALKAYSDEDIAAARQFTADCITLFFPDSPALPDLKTLETVLQPLSWWLAGIAVLSDWLGSNRDLFPYRAEEIPLFEYWEKHAKPQAEKALQQSGVIPLTSQTRQLHELFEYLKPPTPLQNKAADLAFIDAPQLLILEDVTGSGKTEAALMLAHRLIASGRADGVYLGLPTMATSNAMFARVEGKEIHKKFFSGDASLLLAHSAARMKQETPRDKILPDAKPEADYDKEDSAATQRGTWLFDNRKKCLLADFGIGTIDQALLAVLYSRHQALRLLGLSRKVLIVDEVHACDVYMQRLLEGLLEFQAAIGGSVILLSATLPQATRQSLANAYCKGLRREAPELDKTAYPLLTRVSLDDKADEIPLDTRREVARTVEVRLVHELADIHQQLQATHQAGQCACWIRNTVNDAMQAIADLHAAGVPPECIELFHARFALGDRLNIENRVLANFGKDSTQAQRAGRILVATQVVEQSLDLDFDLLVSDLAPMDLLIQRAGRLRRHVRDAAGNPSDKLDKDERGTPVFYVYGPESVSEPDGDWYKDFFPGAAYVYEHHGQLWLTAEVLRQAGAIVMPKQARDLIEGVYGDQAQDSIPQALQENAGKMEGQEYANKANAMQSLVKLKEGYTHPDFNFWDDTQTMTRLGERSITLRLAKWENGELVPWFAADKFAWELSQVSVRASMISDELATAKAQKEERMYDKGRWCRLVVLHQDGEAWRGEAVGRNGEAVTVIYDAVAGLCVG
jgi:CRISPR-associated endonuclease/helicase Cas3